MDKKNLSLRQDIHPTSGHRFRPAIPLEEIRT